MYGDELIPLNQMENIFPDIYQDQVSKYKGREKILKRSIPKIDCLWNDVLHFSSISPQIIFSRLRDLEFGSFANIKWFEIPIDTVKNLPVVIYYAPQVPRDNFLLTVDDIRTFDANVWQEPRILTTETEQYFLNCKNEGKSPLAFQFVPHVLVKGRVSIKDLPEISLK